MENLTNVIFNIGYFGRHIYEDMISLKADLLSHDRELSPKQKEIADKVLISMRETADLMILAGLRFDRIDQELLKAKSQEQQATPDENSELQNKLPF